VVFYSDHDKQIIWGELTVPLERNILDAHLRKKARYAELKANLKTAGWTVHAFTWEIGSLGFISQYSHGFLSALGFSNNQQKHMRSRLSKMALRSSYYIWMARHTISFLPPTLIARPPRPTFHTYPPPQHTIKRPPLRCTALDFLSSLSPVPSPKPFIARDIPDDKSDADSDDIIAMLSSHNIPYTTITTTHTTTQTTTTTNTTSTRITDTLSPIRYPSGYITPHASPYKSSDSNIHSEDETMLAELSFGW
jgi:hypothetical protein